MSSPDLNAQLVNANKHIARLQKALDISARDLRAANRLINTLHSEALDARPAPPPPLPPPSSFNHIPYKLVVNSIELNSHRLRHQLSHRILRSDPYCPTGNYFAGSHWYPHSCREEDDPFELFRDYNHFLDITESTPPDPSDHL